MSLRAIVRGRLRRSGGLHAPGSPPTDLSGAGLGLEPAGRATPRSASARLAPPAWEPAVLTALSRWIPRAPAGPAARAAAYAWAAPTTIAGFLVGAVTGARPRVHDGVVVFAGAAGPVARLLTRRGFDATAIGHVVIARGEPSPQLMRHELVHVRQAERFGVLMGPVYLVLHLLYGYTRHPMERAARRAVRLHLGAPE